MASLRQTVAALCACAPLVLALEGGTFAADLQNDLRSLFANYAVTSWHVSDGAPDGSIYAIVQDPDGYLWIGSEVGLYRFDGMRFVPWTALSSHRLPDGPVQALHMSPDGTLWVGFGARGGVSRVRGKETRNYNKTEGLPTAAISTLKQDQSGTMWAGGDAGLYYFDNDRWRRWPAGAGVPDGTIWGSHVDDSGTLYITMPQGLFRRVQGNPRFEEVANLGGIPTPSMDGASRDLVSPDGFARGIATDRKGRIYVSDLRFGFRMVEDRGGKGTKSRGRGLQLLFDRAGHLWVGTSGQGVWRVRQPDALGKNVTIERVTALTGLANEGAFALLEDRDGNIWVGGAANGLTRLTPHRFVPIRYEGVVRALSVTPEGRLWIGTSDSLIEVTNPDQSQSLDSQHPVGSPVHALHTDQSGVLWVVTRHDLFRVDRTTHKLRRISRSPHLQQTNSITSHKRHGLVFADSDRGLLRMTDQGDFVGIPLPDHLQRRRILAIYADSRDRLWITFATGSLAILDSNNQLTELDRTNGFDAGVYHVIHEDSDGVIWLGGTVGLSRYEEGHVITFYPDERLPVRAVRAIEHDQYGNLWLGTSSGIIRIKSDSLRRAFPSSYRPEYALYDKSDGLAGLPVLLSDATSVRTKGGALWFITREGISIVQVQPPQDERPASRHVDIVGVSVDDRQTAAAPGVSLSAGTRRLQIDYSALNLTSPQKTHFRYRLDGSDSDWVEAGSNRQATYTNLAAGKYRFRVSATSAPGKWGDKITEWEFSIEPRFYKTWWFLTACGALVPLAMWVGWVVRLRQERIRFSLVLAERARLSREIHDTLLQGLVGLGMQCDALANDLDAVAPQTRDRFVRLRNQTTRYVKEAREAIMHLRASSQDREVLASALQRLGEQIATSRLEFSVLVKGAPRVLDFEIEQQVVRIAREAVTNAVLHAREARHLQIDLEYGTQAMVLRVSDDGNGFARPVADETNGHYGIASMRERAKALNGTLHLETSGHRGTCVEVTVPFAAESAAT